MAKKNNNKSQCLNEASTDVKKTILGDQTVESNTIANGPQKTTAVEDASKLKNEVVPKTVFNTSKAAELVGNGASGAADLGGAVMRAAGAIRYSGSADFVGGDYSATVKGTSVRKSGDRPGRTIDTPLQKIDDAPAETFNVPIETIPMINDGANKIAYNGRYRNAHLISQKGSGGSPADSDFFRTIDTCEYDNIYYCEGQINAVCNDCRVNLEVKDYDVAQGKYKATDFTTTLSNYLPTELEVTFDRDNNSVSKIQFKEYDLGHTVSEDVYRVAGDAHLRNVNINETDRLAMIAKAGDESKDNWSPLGQVIPNSSDTNRALKEVDAVIGDMMAMSMVKLSSALAYQNNKAAKDGLRKIGPMFEMCQGLVPGSTVRLESHNEQIATLFEGGGGFLDRGSAALYVAIKDSTPKYNTKGKLLSLPLSFKTALATAKANHKSLYAHTSFIDEFKKQESFGKIDNDGSGLTPVFLSDGAKLISPISFEKFFTSDVIVNPTSVRHGKISNLFTMHYEDLRNKYDFPVFNYLTQGLADWFNRHASKILEKISANKLTIQMSSTTGSISLWDLILCDACKDIVVERQYAMRLVNAYTINNGYPYSGVTQLDYDAIIPSGLGFSDISNPLTLGVIPLEVGARILMPEVFTPIATKDNDAGTSKNNATKCYAVKTILPWYFNQNQFVPVTETVSGGTKAYKWGLNAEGMSTMTFFDYRGGITFGNADRIKALDPWALKRAMDRMVVAPAMDKQSTNAEGYDTTVYKYSYHEDGIPCMNYIAYSEEVGNRNLCLMIRDILATPREIGLSFIAPAGVVTPTRDNNGLQNFPDLADAGYFVASGPSFRVRRWVAVESNLTQPNMWIASRSSGAEVNYTAKYGLIECNPYSAATDFGVRLTANDAAGSLLLDSEIPFVISSKDGHYDAEHGVYVDAETAVENSSSYQPYYTYNGERSFGLKSMLKYMYTRVQMMPFVINPFDVNVFDLSRAIHGVGHVEWNAINETDPYDFLHLFNMCGFRCGEYSGEEYNRNKERIELGLGYVADPYMQ